MPDPQCSGRQYIANGPVSVEPSPVIHWMRSPTVSTASASHSSQTRCARPAPEKKIIFTPAEEFLAQRRLGRRNGISSSKPFGTLKKIVGAISRRLRTVASMPPGIGRPSSI